MWLRALATVVGLSAGFLFIWYGCLFVGSLLGGYYDNDSS